MACFRLAVEIPTLWISGGGGRGSLAQIADWSVCLQATVATHEAEFSENIKWVSRNVPWAPSKVLFNFNDNIIMICNYLPATKGGALEATVTDFAATHQESRVWLSPFHPREPNLTGLNQAVDCCSIQPRLQQTQQQQQQNKTQKPLCASCARRRPSSAERN